MYGYQLHEEIAKIPDESIAANHSMQQRLDGNGDESIDNNHKNLLKYRRRNMCRSLSVVLPFLMIISCFNNNSKNGKIEELIFEIDDQKLSESIIDTSLQIVFCPPKNWKSLSEKEKEAFIIKMDSLKKIGSDISIHPKHVFVHSSIHCFLMVHSVDFASDTLDVGEIENEYNAYLLNKFENQVLKKGIFLKDNILMTQYVIKDGARIIFKLFFRIKNNRLVQFDYFVFSNHEKEIRAIESSIGSIKRL